MKSGSTAVPRLLAMATLAFAAALLAAAWPRLSASVHFLPVDTAIGNYWRGVSVPPEQLELLSRRAEQAIGRHDHYRYWDGLSVLRYLQGMDSNAPLVQRRRALRQSQAAAQEVLRRAPTRPEAWLRIAAAAAGLGQPAGRVVAALKMSIFTGRVEPTLLPLRLRLGYAYLEDLDAESLHLLGDQTALTWRLQERAVLAALRDGTLAFDAVARVLEPAHAEVLADMEARLGQPAR